MRVAWSIFCLVVMIGLFCVSAPANAVSGPVAVSFPGFEPMPTPTYAPYAPRPGFSGGAVVVPGEVYVPGRGGVLVPGRFGARQGASRAIARALFRNPYVVAGIVLGWLAYEGIKTCQDSGGAYFWCINQNDALKNMVFGAPSLSQPLPADRIFSTPQQAFASVYANSWPPPGWSRSFGACNMVNGNKYRWECTLTYFPPSGSPYPPSVNKLAIWGYDKIGSNTTYVPATEADFDRVADNHPLTQSDLKVGQTIDPNADAILNNAGSPVPVSGPAIRTGFASAIEGGRPYPCAAFASGSCIDGWRISPYPTPECPNCVRLDPVTVDATNTEAQKPPIAGDGTPSDTDTSTSDPATKPDKERDPCEVNPDRLGCARLGEDEGKAVPKVSKTVSFTAEFVGLPAACPLDIPGPKGVYFSFAPACDAARQMRPLVVALGAMAALMIVISAVRS